jgi:hypothetical protein
VVISGQEALRLLLACIAQRIEDGSESLLIPVMFFMRDPRRLKFVACVREHEKESDTVL